MLLFMIKMVLPVVTPRTRFFLNSFSSLFQCLALEDKKSDSAPGGTVALGRFFMAGIDCSPLSSSVLCVSSSEVLYFNLRYSSASSGSTIN